MSTDTISRGQPTPIIDLRGANLEAANLQVANLRGARLERADLRATNLEGATMPDGTKHE